jgi:hypothetical protein
MNINTPKIFISYSWSTEDRVIELAQRLVNNGVDVVLDKWALKEGQDKYAFMERSVADESICKVLMICDKSYAEKADRREGGVGDETMVISPEVYAKATETKFIPIVFEKDEEGNAYLPAYLKSRIYIDLTEDEQYEKNYENLLRNLFNKPAYSKPSLGKMPEYLNEQNVDLLAIRTAIRQMQSIDEKNTAKMEFVVKKFNDDYISSIISFAPAQGEDFGQKLLQQIDAMKPARDLYLDYIETLIRNILPVDDIICTFLEKLYNDTHDTHGEHRFNYSEFEFYDFVIWELLICTIAELIHYEKYADIYKIINRTYFIRKNPFDPNITPNTYLRFIGKFSTIESICKQKSETNYHSLASHILVAREKHPVITKQSIVEADLLLYQMSLIFQSSSYPWFPFTYCYRHEYETQDIWVKMVSKKYCERIFPLFGVSSIVKLREIIANCNTNREIRYPSSFEVAPLIQHSITVDEIGTLP